MRFSTSTPAKGHIYSAALLFCVGPTASAISVTIVASNTVCTGAVGSLTATVQNGAPPYTYNWYMHQSGVYQPFCLGCTNVISNLADGSYRLNVTDALGATAQVDGYVSTSYPQIAAHTTYPYKVVGEPMIVTWDATTYLGDPGQQPWPFLTTCGVSSGDAVVVQNNWNWARATGNVMTGPGQRYIYVSPTGPTASICPTPSAVQQLFVPGPTVLPAMTVLQTLPSCSNSASGIVELAITNGVLPNGSIYINLKNSAGTIVQSRVYGSSNIPAATYTFSGLASGSYRIVATGLPSSLAPYPNLPSWFTYTCRDSIEVVVPAASSPCGIVQGKVFIDAIPDCIQQGNETTVPEVVLKVLPGPYFTSTNSVGEYLLQLPQGDYTINEEHAQIGQSCSAQPIPFTVPAGGAAVTRNVPCSSLVALDADIRILSGPARPGFALGYGVRLRNLTPPSTGNISVSVQLDPVLSFTSANPAPTSINGNTLTWNQSALGAFAIRNISITGQVPADVGLLGTTLSTTASLATTITDGNPSNNQAVCLTTVTGSYDPNDKLAITSTGSRTHYDPAQDQWIDYTLRFQNTGTDTAFFVVITDTLPANLDPGTLTVGAASHNFTWSLQAGRTLRFQFVNIKLPHMGINEPRSHGFVSFRIKPLLPLAPGAQIINRANIYFDFNPPVITDPSVLTVPSPPVLLSPRVYLGGVYSASTPPMSDALRAQGRVPLLEPYTALGYAHAGGGGGELVQPSVLQVTGNDAIVDWVIVELRQAGGAGAVVASRSALLQRDGDVVAPNGTSPVAFHVAPGSYRVAIRHRNHLGAMTSTALSLTTSTTAVNFTSTGTSTYGVNAQLNTNGVMALWPGDTGFDGTAKYVGANNDRDPILVAIGGSTPTSTVSNVYSPLDVNMDGVIKYVGANNDRDQILTTVGGSTPTNTRVQQLP